MATDNKDFKVKHGLAVSGGGSFGGAVSLHTPTQAAHATTKDYVDQLVDNMIHVQSTAPSGAFNGMLWFNTSTFQLNVYVAPAWEAIDIADSVDTKISASATNLTNAYQIYADNAAAGALQDAKDYTDAREIAITSAYQNYADLAEAAANTYAEEYADSLANNYEPVGAVSTHSGTSSGVHGITGNVVGTTDTQTLSNKTLGSKLDANNYTISNLPLPENSHEAASKEYVDSVAQGLQVHEPVNVATTGNISLSSPPSTIDGVTTYQEMRVLVKDQTAASENGIYRYDTGVLVRALDYNSVAEIDAGDFVFVINGTVNGGTGWTQTAVVTSLGTDPIYWSQFSGAGSYTAGAGLLLNGTEFSVDSGTTGTIATKQYVGEQIDAITVDALELTGTMLPTNITDSYLTSVGTLTSLNVSGNAVFTGAVTVPTPTTNTSPATKAYVDQSITDQNLQSEVRILDDVSKYFDGYTSRFLPTYQGVQQTLNNPFNLLITIDGIIQSVGYPDYVWQSPISKIGYRIDSDGYLAFPEAVPVGSTFQARLLPGAVVPTITNAYPFRATDILLGGY